MTFEIIDEIVGIEIIAVGSKIHDLAFLQKVHGRGRWRKLKGLPMSDWQTGMFTMLNFTGTKRMESVEKTLKSNDIWINL